MSAVVENPVTMAVDLRAAMVELADALCIDLTRAELDDWRAGMRRLRDRAGSLGWDAEYQG